MNRQIEEQIETVGTVVFLLFHIGTKSEGKVPFLYIDRDTMYKLVLRGDNPFENKGLHPFDGQRVRVTGVKKENIKKEYAAGTLIADSIVPEGGSENKSSSERPQPGLR